MSQLYYQNYNTKSKTWRDYNKYGVFTYVYERDWFKGTTRDLNKLICSSPMEAHMKR